MNKTDNSRLRKIFSDNTSGSVNILLELHEHLQREQKMLEVFPALINEIKQHFKTFQSVQNYIDELEQNLRQGKKLDAFFKRQTRLLENVYSEIFRKHKNIFSKFNSVVTISNSKTVFKILKLIKKQNPKIKVYVCESRPIFEGRITAELLANTNIDVELLTEAAITSIISNVDAAIIGADIILKNGNVVNKIGSNPLAVMCKYYSVPFYVVADKNKISDGIKFNQKEKPSTEIWRSSNSKIKIRNFYFEEINKKLITKVLNS
jgi:translation initiation factor 2B subunit (eIF-2B alpha/beta/delta family)